MRAEEDDSHEGADPHDARNVRPVPFAPPASSVQMIENGSNLMIGADPGGIFRADGAWLGRRQ